MSKKQQRVGMLISLRNSLADIECDAENQTAKILKSNMAIMQKHVADIIALDGITGMRPSEKVGE